MEGHDCSNIYLEISNIWRAIARLEDRQLLDRLKALEEALKEFKDWKEWTVYNRFQEIDGNTKSNASRLNKLEEWKKQQDYEKSKWDAWAVHVNLYDRRLKDLEEWRSGTFSDSISKGLRTHKKVTDESDWDHIKLCLNYISEFTKQMQKLVEKQNNKEAKE